MVPGRFTNVLIEGDLSVIDGVLKSRGYQIVHLFGNSIAVKKIINEISKDEYSLMVTAGNDENYAGRSSFGSLSERLNPRYQITFDDLDTADAFESGDKKNVLDSCGSPIYIKVNTNNSEENLRMALLHIESDFSTYRVVKTLE